MSRPGLDDIYGYEYPTQTATTRSSTGTSNASQSPFLPAFGDLVQLEGDLLRRRYDDMDDHYNRIQSQAAAGTSTVDPRLLMLLEFSRELYSRRSELFEKLFPGLHDDFIELLKRIDAMLLQGNLNNFHPTQVRSLQRSLSDIGSPRTPSSTGGEEDFRLQRFKVRTIVVGGGEPADQGGSGGGQSDAEKGGGAN